MNRYFYAFLLAFSFSVTSAYAQDTVREVEEVVVTALRKETTLQDTAITITAITSEDLEVRQQTIDSTVSYYKVMAFIFPFIGITMVSTLSLQGIGMGTPTSRASFRLQNRPRRVCN